MAFQRPAIHVYQEFITSNPTVTTPFFEACIVGPCYQVVHDTYIRNQVVPIGSDYIMGANFESGFPNIYDLAAVKVDYTSAVLKDVMIKIWPSYVPSADAAYDTCEVQNDERITKIHRIAGGATSSFTASDVKVGDTVYVKVGTSITTATVNAIKDAETFYLSKNIPTPLGTVGTTFSGDVTIIRPLGSTLALATNPALTGGTSNGLIANETSVKLDGSLTTTSGGVTYRVYSGKVYLDYKALRRDMSGDFVQIRTNAEKVAKLGADDVENPLGLAASIVLQNAEISFKVLPIYEDSKAGYLKALDLLSTSSTVYAVCPLTQDKDVVSAYKAHLETMSTPEKSKWRVSYMSMKMPVDKVIIELNQGSLQKELTDTLVYLIDQADGKFGSKEAAIGDFCDIYDDATGDYLYSLQISNIVNESVVLCTTTKFTRTTEGYVATATAVTGAVNQAIRYEVNRRLSPYGIAQEMVTIAKSFNTRRVRLIMPDEVVMTVNSVDHILPGYYLCAAYTALRAAFPPHQGFTTMGISGFKALRHSNKYFTDDDLDLMAGGGVFVVVQDNLESLPYCIYQTTTDTTDIKTREDSCVATIDFASMMYRDNLKPVLGKFNVNEISTTYVSSVIEDCTTKMKRMKYPYIGPLLVDGKLKSMTTNVDKIIPIVGIVISYPVNEVDLYLQI